MHLVFRIRASLFGSWLGHVLIRMAGYGRSENSAWISYPRPVWNDLLRPFIVEVLVRWTRVSGTQRICREESLWTSLRDWLGLYRMHYRYLMANNDKTTRERVNKVVYYHVALHKRGSYGNAARHQQTTRRKPCVSHAQTCIYCVWIHPSTHSGTYD